MRSIRIGIRHESKVATTQWSQPAPWLDWRIWRSETLLKRRLNWLSHSYDVFSSRIGTRLAAVIQATQRLPWSRIVLLKWNFNFALYLFPLLMRVIAEGSTRNVIAAIACSCSLRYDRGNPFNEMHSHCGFSSGKQVLAMNLRIAYKRVPWLRDSAPSSIRHFTSRQSIKCFERHLLFTSSALLQPHLRPRTQATTVDLGRSAGLPCSNGKNSIKLLRATCSKLYRWARLAMQTLSTTTPQPVLS